MLESKSQKGPARARWPAAAGWLLLAAALVAGFAHTFSEMWDRWFPAWDYEGLSLHDRIMEGGSYYTHAPLVPLVSLVMALLLIRHTSIPVRPARPAGLAVVALGVLLHVVSCLARVTFASGFALIIILAGLVLLLWGYRALRRLWFPIAFLVFMVPLPEVTIADLNFRLKVFSANVGVQIANGLGILVERSGNRVFLAGGKSLVIANVCNGLRTLISLLAFGALYAYVCRLRGLWRLLLFAASVPVAVAANSIRIVSLIVVADVWTVEIATDWWHDFSGVMIYVLAFLLMFGLEKLILAVRKWVKRPAKVEPLFASVRRTDADACQWPAMVAAMGRPSAQAGLVLVIVAAAGALWLGRSVPPVWDESVARRALPQRVEIDGVSLQSYTLEMDRKTLAILETQDYLYRRYVGGRSPYMDFCIIFSQDNRKGTHQPDLCLEGSGEAIMGKGSVTIVGIPGRGPVPCRELIVRAGEGQDYYLYTYKCGREYTGNFWKQQFVIFTNGLLHRNASGALIRLSTPIEESIPEARARCVELMRASVPHLDEALP